MATLASARPASVGAEAERWPPIRNLVFRADGKLVNVVRKQGQLLVCTGCCCGHTERGHAAVPTELFHHEWERRKLRNRVHLTIGGCLGPCALANVVELIFDGHVVFFQAVDDEATVLQIYNYLDAMLTANRYVPPPPALTAKQFTAFDWESRPDGAAVEDARRAFGVASRTPGFLYLTHADTDLLAIRAAVAQLPPDFPPVRAYNLLNLKTDADVDAFFDAYLVDAEIVIVRVHGGRASFGYGFERLQREAAARGTWLLCIPGTDALDPELTAISNVGVPVLHELFAYLQYGGADNVQHALRFLADHLLTTGFAYDPPVEQPRHGVYLPGHGSVSLDHWRAQAGTGRPTVGLLFYRAHLLSGNTAFVDAIVEAGDYAGLNILPVFAYSLKGDIEEGVPAPLRYFDPDGGVPVGAIISTISFALGSVDPDAPTQAGWNVEVLESLGVPVYQAVTVASTRAAWAASQRGLSPVDAAMNVVLPEFDGRIGTVPVSFKEIGTAGDRIGDAVQYVPDLERIGRLIQTVKRTLTLQQKPNREKRIAFVLTNSTARISRIGNAVGLDASASLLRLMTAMQAAGYNLGDLPPDGDTLLHTLIDRCSYDLEVLTEQQQRTAVARVPVLTYARWFSDLPPAVQQRMVQQWGEPPGIAYVHDGAIALAGLRFGNTFVALQPPRGYGMDPNAIYHQPDLPPPHSYYALYRWLRDADGFAADAIVHVGKHGTLEWLPGKATAPSADCFPDALLADIPLVYPFIINDPGEGAQAKRRAHAVIVDHLTPPMTAAGSYGDLAELAQLVDEYYAMETLDPAKLPVLQRQIWDVVQRAHLDTDIEAMLNRKNVDPDTLHAWDPTLTDEGAPASMEEMGGKDVAHLIQEIDGYLCELGSAQIRDGLHILGCAPAGDALVDLLDQLVRLPNLGVPSLRDGLARAYGLDHGTLLVDAGARLGPDSPDQIEDRTGLVAHADVLEAIEHRSRQLLATLADGGYRVEGIGPSIQQTLPQADANHHAPIAEVLRFVCDTLVPRLAQTDAEITAVLRALDGRYIPAGPSGAPTRGMAHVLPTGRNFYAVDPRAIPSQAAWRVGGELADAVLARYRAETGDYPESVGLSIWGTSAMRTAGDDIAQVFSLLGVRPRWQEENHRLLGVEPVPLTELGRPRVDVVCRISGFFRDAFPGIVAAIDDAVRVVTALDEPPEQNFVRKHYLAERSRLRESGVGVGEADRRALYRVFGCKPGSYGAGILPLIDEKNWTDVTDFAEAYVNWGGYAYTADGYGVDAHPDFEQQLRGVQVAVKNQDNREHDIFDSDDYLQYHGGMIATIRALTGHAPRRYFGDSADPSRPRVRDLKEEALRVVRSRVINPKWIASIQRHGYKGALELAATVDYLFGYDATSDVLDDWVYEQVTEAYLLDEAMRAFLQRSNPWAMKDMVARMVEAIARGMWQSPTPAMRARLEQIYLQADAEHEARDEARTTR